MTEITHERNGNYGSYADNARIQRGIVELVLSGNKAFTHVQRSALEMIACKLARISNKPELRDNWEDTRGYAKLVMDEMDGVDAFGNPLDGGEPAGDDEDEDETEEPEGLDGFARETPLRTEAKPGDRMVDGALRPAADDPDVLIIAACHRLLDLPISGASKTRVLCIRGESERRINERESAYLRMGPGWQAEQGLHDEPLTREENEAEDNVLVVNEEHPEGDLVPRKEFEAKKPKCCERREAEEGKAEWIIRASNPASGDDIAPQFYLQHSEGGLPGVITATERSEAARFTSKDAAAMVMRLKDEGFSCPSAERL